MLRTFRFGGAAAAVLAAVAGVLWFVGGSATYSFAQIVHKVQDARSVTFRCKQKLVPTSPTLEQKFFLQGNNIRVEIPGKQEEVPVPPDLAKAPILMAMIGDFGKKQGLKLDFVRKTAEKFAITDEMARHFDNPVDGLRKLTEKDAERIGDEKLDGRETQVFRLKKLDFFGARGEIKDGELAEVWVDARSGLPVRFVLETIAADRGGKMTLVFDQFAWNVALDAGLFSLAIPQDFRVEEPQAAVIKPNRIYYHQGWNELHSVQPEGALHEVQFVPRLADGSSSYISEMTELSPDGRYLAIGYTRSTKRGGFPPGRVLLWDRVHPDQPAVEVYARPQGELQFWQFSPDGQRLNVSWWEQGEGKSASDGHYGADEVDLAAKTARSIQLPVFNDKDGQERAMRFAAASPDGETRLVVGDGLYLATGDGKLVRRLGAAEAVVLPASVRFSPDGKQATYVTYRAADRSQQLFVVAIAGGAPVELIAAGKATDLRARWSPDGKRIAYTSRVLDPNAPPRSFGTETYLKTVAPDGTNEVTVLKVQVYPNATSLELTAWR